MLVLTLSVQRRSEWKCSYCGKVFKNEHYTDKHMVRKHIGELHTAEVSILITCSVNCHVSHPRCSSY